MCHNSGMVSLDLMDYRSVKLTTNLTAGILIYPSYLNPSSDKAQQPIVETGFHHL